MTTWIFFKCIAQFFCFFKLLFASFIFFNSYYKDCCAATCLQPSCGIGYLTEAFGVAVNASEVVGFPDCKDPSMVPITIHVQNFVSSVEPQFFFLSQWGNDRGYDVDFRKNLTSKFGDLEGIRENFNEFITWLNENDPNGYTWSKDKLSFILYDSITTVLSLYCDQKNVISIVMNKSMEDNSEIVMVEDGAECTLEIENTTDWSGSIWYFNYTIYHDQAMQVKIDEGSSLREGTKQFIRIKDCFLETIFGYDHDFKNFNYMDLMRKFNWIGEHDAGNQPCSSDFSMERYALSMMNMALTYNVTQDTELWMNDDMHCTWPSVECKQGLVVGLDLTRVESLSSGESGFMIPNEIGILTNLQKLDLYNTGLIGSIPTEVGLLTELTSLRLGKRLL